MQINRINITAKEFAKIEALSNTHRKVVEDSLYIFVFAGDEIDYIAVSNGKHCYKEV